MNKIIPQRIPEITNEVWWPMNVASRTTSRHHWIIVMRIIINPMMTHIKEKLWNHAVNPEVNVIAPKEPIKGQGLYSTKWKGIRGI